MSAPPQPRLRYAPPALAQRLLPRWGGRADTLELLGQSASAVYAFRDARGERQVLRLTDASFRMPAQVRAELDFLAHLAASGCPVNVAIPGRGGALVEVVRGTDGDFVCCALTFQPGQRVGAGSAAWGTDFFRDWGRSLASLHVAAAAYHPPAGQGRLWQWDEEVLFARMDELLPAGDEEVTAIIRATMTACEELPQNPQTFGLIHGDFGPQNFHYSPAERIVRAFDFGNACYHYYLADVANVLRTIAGEPNREEIRRELLRGYAEVASLPEGGDAALDLLVRLRHQYVYLDRLYTATASTRDSPGLRALRQRVVDRVGAWW